MVVATVGVAHEQLVAVLNPSHRPPQLHRCPGHADGFALDIGLEAEGGADIGATTRSRRWLMPKTCESPICSGTGN